MKATNIVKINESGKVVSEAIFKDPKTQAGKSFSKASAKGFLKVVKEDGKLVLKDNILSEEMDESDNMLELVYLNGKIIKTTTLSEIRAKIKSNL